MTRTYDADTGHGIAASNAEAPPSDVLRRAMREPR
jgi:hypothetical protein